MKNNTWQKKNPLWISTVKGSLRRKSYAPSPLSVFSFPWWHVRRGKMLISQNTADKKFHHTQPVTWAETAPCLLSSPELNLLLTSGESRVHFSPRLGSFSSWSLPSALLACLAHLFANMSPHSGWVQWGHAPEAWYRSLRFFSMLPLVFVHYSFVIHFVFRLRVKIKADLPFLGFISLLAPAVYFARELHGIFI